MIDYFDRNFKTVFLFIFLFELFSLHGYLLPAFNGIAFLFISLLVLFLAVYRFEYGVFVLLAELFVGSKGYLFLFDYDGISISIRMAFWLIVMSVWFGKIVAGWIKNKKISVDFLRMNFSFYFYALFLFILWSVVNGFLRGNGLNNIFFDFNGWLYFLLIFPVSEALKNKENKEMIISILFASVFWLSIKTLFLLFVFSHNLSFAPEIYRWVRTSGVGEITQMQGGFYRVFFQSHVFSLAAVFFFLLKMAGERFSGERSGRFAINAVFTSFLISSILISFSRSFWVGFVAGLFLFYFVILKILRIGWKEFFTVNLVLFLSVIASAGLMILAVKFPYPKPTGGFNAINLLSERVSAVSGEAAVSSRWALLPELASEIKKAPLFGKGFGATVTYKSSDPRVLESSSTGEYTTYAFEWGWLDIWLKIGFFGLLAYLFLIGKILISGLKNNKNDIVALSFAVGLVAIVATSFFSPYLNHPLGIGYLILLAAVAQKKKEPSF